MVQMSDVYHAGTGGGCYGSVVSCCQKWVEILIPSLFWCYFVTVLEPRSRASARQRHPMQESCETAAAGIGTAASFWTVWHFYEKNRRKDRGICGSFTSGSTGKVISETQKSD